MASAPSRIRAFSLAVNKYFWLGVIVKLSKARLLRIPCLPLLLDKNLFGMGSEFISLPEARENFLIKG